MHPNGFINMDLQAEHVRKKGKILANTCIEQPLKKRKIYRDFREINKVNGQTTLLKKQSKVPRSRNLKETKGKERLPLSQKTGEMMKRMERSNGKKREIFENAIA